MKTLTDYDKNVMRRARVLLAEEQEDFTALAAWQRVGQLKETVRNLLAVIGEVVAAATEGEFIENTNPEGDQS